MSVTFITPETREKQRMGISFYTIPGCVELNEMKIESLDECVSRVMKTDLYLNTRRREVVNGKHLKRYILERLTVDGKISKEKRYGKGYNKTFRYSLYKIAAYCDIDHCSVLHSSKTAQNLIDTDPEYRSLAEKVLRKIELNLIKFPEL